MTYDSWKTTEPDQPYYERDSQRARDHAWWSQFHRARAAGTLDQFFADYEGIAIYRVLVEDAKRILEAEHETAAAAAKR